jgi:presenilin-like A22 family membrane protease
MQTENSSRFDPSIIILIALTGALYCAMHLLNGWIFHALEVSDHISFIYLPSFLRLFNVLVFGLMWGTAGTAVGGFMLMYWNDESFFIATCNTLVSASSAALAVLAMRVLQHRRISLTRLSDLLQLALLYALLNASIHHLVWGQIDPAQLVNTNQLLYMVVGDINGAIIGALVLRWLAGNTRLISAIRARAIDDSAA